MFVGLISLVAGTTLQDDSTITSAVLDRLLHHAETVVIEGPSYHMKDKADG